MEFFRKVKATCAAEFMSYVNCMEKSSGDMQFYECRRTQGIYDKCVQEKMGLERPSRAQHGQRWPQERARKVTTLNGKIQDVGSGPPRGSKILKIRRYEDPKLRLEVVEKVEKRSAGDLTRRWTVGPAKYDH